jgi:hypothetical protein
MQIQVEPGALYTLHLEAGTIDGNTVRVSIGNIVKSEGAKVCLKLRPQQPAC